MEGLPVSAPIPEMGEVNSPAHPTASGAVRRAWRRWACGEHPERPASPSRGEENRDVKIWPLSCHVMGWHQFRRKPGDKEMLVCQRCGKQELVWTKRMRDKADNPWS